MRLKTILRSDSVPFTTWRNHNIFNDSQEKAFKKSFAEIAVAVLKKADFVCTTTVQVGNKIFDELTFDGAVVDEAGVVTEFE